MSEKVDYSVLVCELKKVLDMYKVEHLKAFAEKRLHNGYRLDDFHFKKCLNIVNFAIANNISIYDVGSFYNETDKLSLGNRKTHPVSLYTETVFK